MAAEVTDIYRYYKELVLELTCELLIKTKNLIIKRTI